MLTRLSVDGAKTFWTCNPASPYHFIKTEYIDRIDEINEAQGGNGLCYFSFDMEDNLSLSEDYKRSLKSTLRGVFYDRSVLGLMPWPLYTAMCIEQLIEFREHLYETILSEAPRGERATTIM